MIRHSPKGKYQQFVTFCCGLYVAGLARSGSQNVTRNHSKLLLHHLLSLTGWDKLRYFATLTVFLTIFLTGCSKNPCIDPELIDNSVFCPASYAPVCGCDNITYTNECVAQKRGVTFFIPGACL